MHAYGYEDREWGEDDPNQLKLRAVTVVVSDVDELLRLQRFVSEVLSERMRMGAFDSSLGDWHDHLRDRDPDWSEQEPDLIIYFDSNST